MLLLAAVALAIGAANSPFSSTYFWADHYARHWVNDGLMTIYFYQIGLELKHEVTNGALSSFKRAAFPLTAAIGGMLAPILIFAGVNGGFKMGWPVPMATDIAFSLALLGAIAPKSKLRPFLLALAIVDDLGAILVIAIVFARAFNWIYLITAALEVFLTYLLTRFDCKRAWMYLLFFALTWAMLLHSGLHPSLAGVLSAWFVPADIAKRFLPPLEKLNAKVILPLFALANAGVHLRGTFDVVAIGIFCGLFIGKPIGILGFSYLGETCGWLERPRDTRWRELTAVSLLCGIGFTMSLFLAELARLQDAKLAVLAGSAAAGLSGAAILKTTLSRRRYRSEV